MTKSATLITSAFLTLGLAAGAMAADLPTATTPSVANASATTVKTADTTPSKPAKKSSKKKKKAAAPTT